MKDILLPLLAQTEPSLEASLAKLGSLPAWVLVFYLLVLLVLGWFGWKRSHADEEDYYLAGRGQGWLVSSVTIMATFFSSFALLGAPGMVYRDGVMFALFSLNVPFAGLCVYLLGSRIWKLGRAFSYVTPGDMVADYYASRYLLRILVAIASVLYVLPYVVMQIQSGGIISEKLFPGSYTLGIASWGLHWQVSSFELGAIVLAAVTMVYIMIGGMRSVAWTDLIQGVLLITGMLVSGFAMFLIFGSPGEFGRQLSDTLPASSLTIPGNSGGWEWPMLMSVCLLASTGSMVQPAQWMRFYSARNIRTLKRGAVIFAVVLTTCFILGVMLIGLAGQLLFPLTFSIEERIDIPSGGTVPAWEWEQAPHRFAVSPGAESAETATLQWEWVGNASREIPASVLEEAGQLSTLPAYQRGLQELVHKAADEQVRAEPHPHPAVADYNSILVVVIAQELPRQFHMFGVAICSLILVAIMAASMSTADSNLHALSAVATRDVYDQFINPRSSERERVWVGRLMIAVATVLALAAVLGGRDPAFRERYDIIAMIAQMGLMAIAFSAQLLPIAVDVLFLRRGTRAGAAVGLALGLLAVLVTGPLFAMLVEGLGRPAPLASVLAASRELTGLVAVHGSVWGLLVNIPVFVLVSCVTRSPAPETRARFDAVLGRRQGSESRV